MWANLYAAACGRRGALFCLFLVFLKVQQPGEGVLAGWHYKSALALLIALAALWCCWVVCDWSQTWDEMDRAQAIVQEKQKGAANG